MRAAAIVWLVGVLCLVSPHASTSQSDSTPAEIVALRRQLRDPDVEISIKLVVLRKLADATRTPSAYADGLFDLADELLSSDLGPCPWDYTAAGEIDMKWAPSQMLLLFYGREADRAIEQVLGADGLQQLLASMPGLALEEERHMESLKLLRKARDRP